MAIYLISVQYNGTVGFSPVLLYCVANVSTIGERTRLNAMKRFWIYLQPIIPPKRFDISPPDWGMLRRSKTISAGLFYCWSFATCRRCSDIFLSSRPRTGLATAFILLDIMMVEARSVNNHTLDLLLLLLLLPLPWSTPYEVLYLHLLAATYLLSQSVSDHYIYVSSIISISHMPISYQ